MSLSLPVTPPPVVDDRTHQNWIGAGPPSNAGRPVESATPGSGFALSGSDRLHEALKKLPNIGEECFGFRMVRELGRGSFGRVYLATQPELAGRFVALKISADLTGESRTLAQLQHTNIVPVYSVHRANGLQGVCMPYFGSLTIADLLKRYRESKTLPASGRQFVDTLRNATNGTEPRTGVDATTPSPAEAGAGTPAPERTEAKTDAILNLLAGFSYVRAVAWLGARIADGLAHAHDRGILHRDVKPANILLTDDGQPMLLDFGIAQDTTARTTAGGSSAVGGTLPYMSPEQLEEVRTEQPLADTRSDVYSVGVVLYELLTGRYPWRVPSGSVEDEIPKMIAERLATPPSVRDHNPDVSPGLESIVHTCLSGDPTRRYQSALHLRDDLDRFLADQPLKVAPERSVKEQVHKWARRHPRLTSTATLAALAVLVLASGAIAGASYQQKLARLDAEQTHREFYDDFQAAQYLLTARSTDSDQVEPGLAKAQAAIDRYRPGEDRWESQPAFQLLSDELKAQTRRELIETCLLLARGHLVRVERKPGDAVALATALRFNTLAENLAGTTVPNAVHRQRAEILKLQGQTAAAAAAAKKAAETPSTSGQDFYLAGWDALTRWQYKEAIPLFRKALEQDPRHFWALLGLGVSQDMLGLSFDARGSYTAAIALWPEFSWTYFNRGIANIKVRDYDFAIADLTKAAELNKNLPDIYVNRALAYQGKNQFTTAIADLDRALAMGAPYTRIYFLRARLKDQAGDKEGAKRDLAEAMKQEPTDEKSWIARGFARLSTDLTGALADFEKAIAANPRSVQALQNKSHILGKQNRNQDCIQVIDRILELNPENFTAKAGRGVIHARLKNWDAALADARDALSRDTSGQTVYQVAGIFSLLSQHNSAYKTEALNLLGAALRAGYGHDLLADDRELDPIRSSPEFQRLVNAVKDLKPTKPTIPTPR